MPDAACLPETHGDTSPPVQPTEKNKQAGANTSPLETEDRRALGACAARQAGASVPAAIPWHHGFASAA